MTRTQDPPIKKARGFAAMSRERQLEIARKGGAAVPAEKRTFSISKAKARAAGSKGGSAVPPEKRTFSNREIAARAGAKGGKWSPKTSSRKGDLK